MKKIIILSLVAMSGFAFGLDISNMGLPEWEALPIYKKAEIMLQTKAEASKSSDGADNYMHIQTLISLSVPLTPEQNKELVKDAAAILQDHPEWGNIKPPTPVQQDIAADAPVKSQESSVTPIVPRAEVPSMIQSPAAQNQAIGKAANMAPQVANNVADVQVVDNRINDSPSQGDQMNLDQQNNLDEALRKLSEQKKITYTPDPKDIANLKLKKTEISNEIDTDTSLYADGNFPAGQFYQTKHLDSLLFDKAFNNTYYLIEPLIIDYPINGSYICHLDESFSKDMHNYFFSEKRQFLVTFPYPTPYLKKGSTVFFSLTYPLTIKGKVKYKDTTGEMITKYICEYQGKSLHSIK